MSSIDDILEQARPNQNVHRVCVRGDLIAEHQRLEADLAAAPEPLSHLAAEDPRVPIAAAIAELEAEMHAAEAEFTFRALGRTKYRELKDRHPGRPEAGETQFNADTFPRELIAACCIDPVMTPADVDRLFNVLNEGATESLFMAAYTVNEGVTRVPFSKAASAVTKRSSTS